MSYELWQQGPAAYIPVILVSLIVTLVAYGAFPLIFAKTRKKVISKKKYNRLCYCFNILVLILFIAINGEPSTGGPYLLWTWVFSSSGIKTLKSRGVLEGFQPIDYTKTSTYQAAVANEPKPEENATDSLSYANEVPKQYGTWNVMGTDLKLEKSNAVEASVNPEPQHQEIPVATKGAEQKTSYTKYCAKCGKGIDPISKVCTGCGKQYFKGVPWKTFGVVVVIALLVASVGLNVYMYTTPLKAQEIIAELSNANNELTKKNNSLKDDIDELKEEIADLNRDLLLYRSLANFCNDYVAFIEDDGTNLYHKYECNRFKGSEFWVYNFNAAENWGYEPCPDCHD